MSSRPNIQQHPAIGSVTGQDSGVSGDMSASITSIVSVLPQVTVGSYSYSWTGTSPVGTIAVEVSNDYRPGGINGVAANAGTWTALYFNVNGSSTPTNSMSVSGNSGTGFLEWNTGAYAIRTKYTRTSGTGTLTAIINGKVA